MQLTGHHVQEDSLVGELADAVAGDEADVHPGVLGLDVPEDESIEILPVLDLLGRQELVPLKHPEPLPGHFEDVRGILWKGTSVEISAILPLLDDNGRP